ncbi:MAG: undecaprenyl-phosphate glucose phosphotransferase [Myxococcota bacterium]|nr:undecaprenyl-phosphate glucose phosphotransferase [Myxococcales bacterium]
MLYRHSEIFRSLLVAADLALVAAAWLGAYALRFHGPIDAPLGVPDPMLYVRPLAVILPLWGVLFRARGLYEPHRTSSMWSEAAAIVRATATGLVALLALSFFVRSHSYSRGVVVGFALLAPAGVIALRTALRVALRAARRRGYNLRFAVVVGGVDLAREVIERIHSHPEAGLRVVGVLSNEAAGRRADLAGVPVVGGYAALKPLLRSERIDQVWVAIPRSEVGALDKVIGDLDDEIASVKIVPDLLHVMSVRSSVEDLGGIPIIHLRDTPLVGWAAVRKRAFDLVLGGAALAIAAPAIAAISLAVWATSGRPVFYSQLRMGLDGRVFRMWKLRTMVRDAERETGPVWATEDDARRTALGSWLRRTSLDELPQLWNVVRGDMSLVGPRPERLAFIEEFRREVPGYMLRHKVKAGLTGWAQVHGWRGNTSLHERIEHDLYYIQNWSLELDVRILLLTLVRASSQRNAY